MFWAKKGHKRGGGGFGSRARRLVLEPLEERRLLVVLLSGTPNDDLIMITGPKTGGPTEWTITINDVPADLRGGPPWVIDALEGHDTVEFSGDENSNQIVGLRPGSLEATSADLNLSVQNVETILAEGTGFDTLLLFDSPQIDVLQANQDQVSLRPLGSCDSLLRGTGFGSITAQSSQAGQEPPGEDISYIVGPLQPSLRFTGSWKPADITFTSFGPVDLVVTDGDGNVVSKTLNQIPGAEYVEGDLDGDGNPDDRIRIPSPLTSAYTVSAIPETGASPDDLVTLRFEDLWQVTTLLDGVMVSDLPAEPIQVSPSLSGCSAPVANADGPYTVEEGNPVTLDGTGSSDPDGTIVTYEWDLDDDGLFDDATGPNPIVPWLTLAGLGLPFGQANPIALHVTNDVGLSDTDASTLKITQRPVANADGPYTVEEGNPVTLIGTGSSDPDGIIVSLEWDLDNDGQFDDAIGANPTVPWSTLAALGLPFGQANPIMLQVTDNDGLTDTDTTTLRIIQPPIADANGTYTIQEGDPLMLDGTGSSDPDGTITSYAWDLDDDGQFDDATGAEPNVPWVALAGLGLPTDQANPITLEVTDNDGLTDTDTTTLTIITEPQPQPPQADANGAYTIQEGDPLLLDGTSSSDPDGTITSYAWDLDDDGQFDDATGAEPNVPWVALAGLGLPTDQANPITLEVTDNDGLTGTDATTLTIIAEPQPQPPQADANGAYTIQEGDPLMLDGTGSSDPDGTITSYAWDLDDDGQFGDATGAEPTVPWVALAGLGLPTDQANPITLEVTDNDGLTDTDTTTLTIITEPQPQPPQADANGAYTIQEGDPLLLDGTGSSDPDGTITSYAWDLDDDGQFDDATGAEPYVPWVALAALGLPTDEANPIALQVTDNDGLTGTDATTLTIIAEPQPQPPQADANGAYTIQEGDPLMLDGTGSSDPDGTITSYAWDLDDDGQFDDATGAEPTVPWVALAGLGLPTDQANPITLEVTDNDGLTDTDTTTLTIMAEPQPQPPIADANGAYTIHEGDPLMLDGAGSTDPDGTITNYAWDLDNDGQFDDATGAEPTVPWVVLAGLGLPTDQANPITLEVTDNDGLTDTDTTTLTIIMELQPQPPQADANGTYTIHEGDPLMLDGTGSSDPDGTITSYAWDLDNDGQFDDATGAEPTVPWVVLAGLGLPTDQANPITLQVTDNDGLTDTDTTTLTIIMELQPQPPQADANGTYTIHEGDPLMLDGTGSSDPDGTITSYAWDLDNDGQFDDATGAEPTVPWVVLAGLGLPTDQANPITLQVTDNDGLTGTDATTLTITRHGPGPCHPLGPITFLKLHKLWATKEKLWYRLQTPLHGFLSLKALYGKGELTLYDEDLVELVSSKFVGQHHRIDWPVHGGQVYHVGVAGHGSEVDVHLANLITTTENTIVVHGAEGDDAFELDLTSPRTITVNGMDYVLDAKVDKVVVDGGGGHNTIVFKGSSGNETLESFGKSARLTSGSFEVDVSGMTELLAVGGGGNDVAEMHGTEGRDAYVGRSNVSVFLGQNSSFKNRVSGFARVSYHGDRDDLARLFDGAGVSNALIAKPYDVKLTGSYITHHVMGVGEVLTTASNDPGDVAQLVDSVGIDAFTSRMRNDPASGKLASAMMKGPGYENFTTGFRAVHAESSGDVIDGVTGQCDTAVLYGLPGTEGDDTYTGTPSEGELQEHHFTHRVIDFPRIHVVAKSGKNDTAYLHGTQEKDRFLGTPVAGRLTGYRNDGSLYFHSAVRFDHLYAKSYGGPDVASFYDSQYGDVFDATPTHARQYNRRMDLNVEHFATVIAHAKYGGPDTAYLSGYDVGTDKLVQRTDATSGEPLTRLYNHVYTIKVQNYQDCYADPDDPWSMRNRQAAALLASASGVHTEEEQNEAIDTVVQSDIWRADA